MQRTISAMVGKGSVNHNSRKFKAENVNADRSHLNIDYCNENIKKVYTELKNFPLYCPKCKQESLINAKDLQVTVIKGFGAKIHS